jgi:hypothetical protein
MTNGELVSRILNSSKRLNKDSYVSKRWIIHIAKTNAKTLMAQKLGEKSLVNEHNLYTTLKCFALEQDDVVNCDIVQFRRCDSLMKSKNRLPETVYSKLGNSIIFITNVDGTEPITVSSLLKHSINKDRVYPDCNLYAYESDGYLYIPDSDIEAVNVTLLAVDLDEVDTLSGCSDCDECDSYWDKEFIVSDKLCEVVMQQTRSEVYQSLNIPEDENPNLDSNQKTQTNA